MATGFLYEARLHFSILTFRSDEGLTLETSAFLIFHGGNSTFIQNCVALCHRRSTTVSFTFKVKAFSTAKVETVR